MDENEGIPIYLYVILGIGITAVSLCGYYALCLLVYDEDEQVVINLNTTMKLNSINTIVKETVEYCNGATVIYIYI